jgi:hypothetical protein
MLTDLVARECATFFFESVAMERTNVMSNTEELKRDLLTVIQFLNRIDVQLLIRDDEVPSGDVDNAFNRRCRRCSIEIENSRARPPLAGGSVGVSEGDLRSMRSGE